MELDLSTLKASKDIKPPRIVLYSTPKWGKTTLAASIPDNLLLDVEQGSGAVSVARIEKSELDTYQKFMTALKGVYEQKHKFKVCTIDTIDWLEDLVFQQAAAEHGKTSIADVGYGAGYVTAQNLWRQVLQGLDMLREERNMMILLLAHEKVVRYDNPLTESYDRYTLKMHDKTVGLIKEWSDAVLFANNETFVKSEDVGFKQKVKRATAGDRVIHTVESPAYVAGNRYGLPAELPATWDALEDALSTAMTEPQTKKTKNQKEGE